MHFSPKILGVFLAGCALLIGLSDPAIAQEEGQKWTTVEHFQGEGQKNTKPFTVESSEWRIVWGSVATTQKGMGHIFQLHVQKPSDDLFMEIAANVANAERASDTSYIYESGRFYLTANAANGEWDIKVQVPSK